MPGRRMSAEYFIYFLLLPFSFISLTLRKKKNPALWTETPTEQQSARLEALLNYHPWAVCFEDTVRNWRKGFSKIFFFFFSFIPTLKPLVPNMKPSKVSGSDRADSGLRWLTRQHCHIPFDGIKLSRPLRYGNAGTDLRPGKCQHY